MLVISLLILLTLSAKICALLQTPDDLHKDLRSCTRRSHFITFKPNIIPLTDATREMILFMHNNYRSSIKPSAANMKHMFWSITLEEAALAYSATCKWALNETDADFTMHAIGINQDVATEGNGRDAIMKWWEERDNYDVVKMICEKGTRCTHFIQLVWAETYSVGCGIARCSLFHYLLTCLYFPSGNLYSYRPYSIGKPCTQCLVAKQTSGDLCLNKLCGTNSD